MLSEPVTTRLFDHQDAVPLEAGQVIFAEGDAATSAFVVKSGSVDISRDGSTVAVIGPGELFGEMSLVDDSPRSARATAVDDVELVEVPADRFEFMVSQTPGFALTVMRTLAHRLRVETGLAT